MKTIAWVGAVLAAGFFAWTGCGKADQAAPGPSDVQVLDASKFRPAFASATPEIKATVDKVMVSIQASDFVGALAGLDKLAGDASLTEPQKKVIKDLVEHV
jgi:hypothetical protein